MKAGLDRSDQTTRRSGHRAEWIGLAVFLGLGLLALPFVHDALIVQQLWLSICSAVGITP